MKQQFVHDLVILGGGPAGMTAAIYAARANLKAIILESNITGGQVNSTYVVENYPSHPHIHGMELMSRMREHVDALKVPVEEVCTVESLALQGTVKVAACEEAVHTAGAMILATGRRPIPPGNGPRVRTGPPLRHLRRRGLRRQARARGGRRQQRLRRKPLPPLAGHRSHNPDRGHAPLFCGRLDPGQALRLRQGPGTHLEQGPGAGGRRRPTPGRPDRKHGHGPDVARTGGRGLRLPGAQAQQQPFRGADRPDRAGVRPGQARHVHEPARGFRGGGHRGQAIPPDHHGRRRRGRSRALAAEQFLRGGEHA